MSEAVKKSTIVEFVAFLVALGAFLIAFGKKIFTGRKTIKDHN